MHPSRGNKSSHCPSHGEVISVKGWENRPATHCRTANQIAVVCCVKSKQTSKSAFSIRGYVEQQSLHSRLTTRFILVIDGLNEISSPFLRLVWFIFQSCTFIPFARRLISESHALAQTEIIIKFLARNQRKGDVDRARISFVNPLKLDWHGSNACQGITEQVMSFCHT